MVFTHIVQNINLKNMKKYVSHYYCYAEMSNKHNKILKYDHGEKPMKAPFIIYANL